MVSQSMRQPANMVVDCLRNLIFMGLSRSAYLGPVVYCKFRPREVLQIRQGKCAACAEIIGEKPLNITPTKSSKEKFCVKCGAALSDFQVKALSKTPPDVVEITKEVLAPAFESSAFESSPLPQDVVVCIPNRVWSIRRIMHLDLDGDVHTYHLMTSM